VEKQFFANSLLRKVITISQHRRRLSMTQIFVCALQKGGVGKTTTAVSLSAGLAYLHSKRVLLIDLDPQGNASMSLGVKIEELQTSVRNLLAGDVKDFKRLWWDKGDNLKILPANSNLKEIEPELLGSVDGRFRLKERLKPILSQFDYIIIDTGPSTGILTQCALVAAHQVIAPIDVGFFSLEGLRQLLETINQVREHFNPELEIAGILLTKFDSRTKLSEQVEEVLRRGFPEKAFRTVIKVNVELIRAQIEKKSIFAVDPDSSGAKDYESLINEILHREQSTKIIPIRSSTRGNRQA
jgi:chromosome partitioning protein